MSQTVLPRLGGVGEQAEGPVSAVVIVLPGGRANGRSRFRVTQLANLRMAPFTASLRGALPGVAVWPLRYRVRGWNDPHLDPVQDARWALGYARRRYPGAAVILVGHSMGGRVALRVAGDPGVVAVLGLAPWIEPGEPVAHLAGRTILVAHGDRDRVTDPRESRLFVDRSVAAGADARFVAVEGEGHAMLRRSAHWTNLVLAFVRGQVELSRRQAPGVS